MIAEARRPRRGTTTTHSPSSSSTSTTIDFILADCSAPTAYAGGPFDIVFAAWLLNYAPDRTALVRMFRKSL